MFNISSTKKEQFSAKEGFIACLPTILGYWSVGFSAGVLSHLAGLSVLEVALLSALLYAGSGQFIFIQMLISIASPYNIISAIFFVNLRHFLMSVFLSRKLPNISTFQAIVIGNHITDESFGVAAIQSKRQEFLSFPWMFSLNTTAYANWFLANVTGALIGGAIPTQFSKTLEFSLVGMFTGLLIQQINASSCKLQHCLVAGSAIALSIPTSIYINKHQSIIISSVLAACLGLIISHYNSKKSEKNVTRL